MEAPGYTAGETEAALCRLKGLLATIGPDISSVLTQLCLAEAPKGITRAEALKFLSIRLGAVSLQPLQARPPSNCASPGPQRTQNMTAAAPLP